MNLVFFNDAVEYLCAVTRILTQPKGNAILIGVAGSGKQSLTKLASFMLEHHPFQLQLSKTFRPSDFRETMRVNMLKAGCDNLKTTFIMTDSQIMHESFLEDVNNILNTGEITSLYAKEDYDRMVESLTHQLQFKKLPLNKESAYSEYLGMLRNNFHTILCMSPIGDMLRIRCRMFPSLVNCCTLIWFQSWPLEALSSVA
jgi:dynein heavy chain, axonemal